MKGTVPIFWHSRKKLTFKRRNVCNKYNCFYLSSFRLATFVLSTRRAKKCWCLFAFFRSAARKKSVLGFYLFAHAAKKALILHNINHWQCVYKASLTCLCVGRTKKPTKQSTVNFFKSYNTNAHMTDPKMVLKLNQYWYRDFLRQNLFFLRGGAENTYFLARVVLISSSLKSRTLLNHHLMLVADLWQCRINRRKKSKRCFCFAFWTFRSEKAKTRKLNSIVAIKCLAFAYIRSIFTW